MNRLTTRNSDGAWDVPLRVDDDGAYIPSQEIIDRLARYEDSGLEPEEIKRSDALLRGFIDLSRRHARTLPWMERVMIADSEGRLIVLPCGDDVTLEHDGMLYKGDHWNPPSLTAFTPDPSTRSGLRVHIFRIEDAEKALKKLSDKACLNIPFEEVSDNG